MAGDFGGGFLQNARQVREAGSPMLTAARSICALLALAFAAPAGADEAAERAAMVRTIERHARDTGTVIAPSVLEVMGATERHRFVPERVRRAAHADRPLPIGYGQTISQPFIVALMTELLDVGSDDAVLEIGTGSGYQAAVLAPLVARVCSIEIVPELGQSAADRLRALGYRNVEVKVADGYHGWPDCGPFDGIVVTAAADHVPPPLVAQLKPGGRMVIPVGGGFATQFLTLVEKTAGGEVQARQLLPVRFVPLTRGG
jgi:protein-L-isoaspartate(D-aspartate) O-methyltransferase